MDFYELRRLAITHLLETAYKGHQGKFAEACGVDPTTVSRWISKPPKKRIGEDLARRLESRLNLSAGSLVYPEGMQVLSLHALRIAMAFERADPHIKAATERVLSVEAEGVGEPKKAQAQKGRSKGPSRIQAP